MSTCLTCQVQVKRNRFRNARYAFGGNADAHVVNAVMLIWRYIALWQAGHGEHSRPPSALKQVNISYHYDPALIEDLVASFSFPSFVFTYEGKRIYLVLSLLRSFLLYMHRRCIRGTLDTKAQPLPGRGTFSAAVEERAQEHALQLTDIIQLRRHGPPLSKAHSLVHCAQTYWQADL